MDVRESDVGTNEHQSENAVTRALILAGLSIKWAVGDMLTALTGAWARRRLEDTETGPFPASQQFSDLPAYTSIIKHRVVADRFNFTDPFYRCHDRSRGALTTIDGREYINFASYDYLGLNGHPVVVAAAKAAIDEHGTSVSASRIVAGERPLHRQLEAALADLYETETAVAFVSGHATNVSAISTLLDSDDLILYDELAHNSLLTGIKLSNAKAFAFRHNDLEHLERLLRTHRRASRNALVVVEGLYSMDGDVADLPKLVELKERYGAWLMVDEAHALGVLGAQGKGLAEHYGIDSKRVDIWMGTLSKALAGCGGYICGSHALVEALKFRASGQVYSVGMSPPVAAAALAALQLMKAEPERVKRVRANGDAFLHAAKARGLDTVTSQGFAIVPIMVGDIIKAGRMTDRMLARGINVLPIIYPAVPLKAARLRFFITSSHTPEQIESTVAIAAEELRRLTAN
ncbi:MAG: aminotransferase class I/II-fold pyridoxal phosphate-dependent enzyme [Hyphomicrobium sp.]